MPLLLLLSLLPLSHAGGWFYADQDGTRVEVDDNGQVEGSTFRLNGALLAEADNPALLRLHPEVDTLEVLSGFGDVVRITPRAGVDLLGLSRRLFARPDVAWCHPDLDTPIVPMALPDDPYLSAQWHLDNTGQGGGLEGADINAFSAWEVTAGAGVLVAVLDSGVDTSHPDLSAVAGYDYSDNDDDSNPPAGDTHGTLVAGTVAAVGNNALGGAGVAWAADIYGIRMIRAGSLEAVRDAFIEAVDAGAAVINNSWGYDTDGCSGLPLYGALRTAFDYAETEGRGGLGSVVVFSAGNWGCDESDNQMLAYPPIVGVSAVNSRDRLESYSVYGDVIDIAGQAGGIITPTIPGEGNYRGDNTYSGGFSGTSSAAPIVSGVFALMFAANEHLTAAGAREALCETATRFNLEEGAYDEEGWSRYFGCGRPDAAAAVHAVANTLPNQALPLSPLERAYDARVLLTWQPAVDPDGDPLQHWVRWWTDGDEEAATTVLVEDGSRHDLTGAVAAGSVLTWTVWATDRWGAGPASEPVTVTIEATPAEPVGAEDTGLEGVPEIASFGSAQTTARPAGCAVSRAPTAAAALGLLALIWRRRDP